MQQDLAKTIHAYLPEINASELDFDIQQAEQDYQNEVSEFTEKIQAWSFTVLENANLPIAASEAKALTTKYNLESNEGCALHMVVELDSITKSLEHNDATTAALASMKLVDAIWHSSIYRGMDETDEELTSSKITEKSKNLKKEQTSHNSDESTALYQNTINELKEKYPHCNVNALRLLAATRLKVSKQELDELDISPE